MTVRQNLGDLADPAADPDELALIDLADPAAPAEWSHRRIDRAASGVARALVARGRQRGDRVAILSANRAEYLVAFLGIMRAGMVAVPVNWAKPVAFVVPVAGARLSAPEVKEWSLANAPAYQHPRHVEFLGALPLAGTNKVDRRALTELALRVAGGHPA